MLLCVLILAAACGRHTPASQSPRSVILVTIDTLRADHVTERLTPSLTALGREAVVFDQAITVAPLTLPAHASLLTGAYPPRHGVRDNQVYVLNTAITTYPELLKQRGYATGAFVSAPVLDHSYGLNRGFDVYDDEIDGPERAGADTLTRAEKWLSSARRPFFIWVHLFEPHAPYRTGSYATEVTAADSALGGFFAFLKNAKLWDDAVVSVTSDHGESLGEHREDTHGFFVYDATLRIPWILKAPGVAARRITELVRIVDELPTVMNVSGLDGGSMPAAPDGVSLAAFLSGGIPEEREAYGETFLPYDQFGWSSLLAVRTSRFKYIESPRPELYDLRADPREMNNIASENPAETARLQRVVDATSRRLASPTPRTKADPALAEKLMALGYIGSAPPMTTGEDLADPKSKVEVYNLTMKALERAEGGDVTGAIRTIDEAERLEPKVPQIAFVKGTLLGQAGRFADAAAALERALALSPGYTAARFKLALAFLRLGRADRARQALDEVVRQRPEDYRAWHNLAAIAYTRGELDEAERLERKAVALSPDYAEAWNTLGAIALVRKDAAAAVDALTKATRLAPRNAQAFKNLSLAFNAAGQPDRARAAADRACALDRQYCSSSGGRP